MSDQNERLKRIREQQLVARDPLAKQRKFQHSSSIKERRMREPFSFAKAWNDIPHIIKYPFYALLIGVVILFVLPMLWDSPYAFWTGVGATVLLMIFGLILGNSIDLRDDIRRHIK